MKKPWNKPAVLLLDVRETATTNYEGKHLGEGDDKYINGASSWGNFFLEVFTETDSAS